MYDHDCKILYKFRGEYSPMGRPKVHGIIMNLFSRLLICLACTRPESGTTSVTFMYIHLYRLLYTYWGVTGLKCLWSTGYGNLQSRSKSAQPLAHAWHQGNAWQLVSKDACMIMIQIHVAATFRAQQSDIPIQTTGASGSRLTQRELNMAGTRVGCTSEGHGGSDFDPA